MSALLLAAAMCSEASAAFASSGKGSCVPRPAASHLSAAATAAAVSEGLNASNSSLTVPRTMATRVERQATSAVSKKGSPQPHIVLVVFDDLGFNDMVGCSRFNPSLPTLPPPFPLPTDEDPTYIPTLFLQGTFSAGQDDLCQAPVMSQLMDDGIKLKQFYTLPVCSPTRAAVMTGRYPLRIGAQTGTADGPDTSRTFVPKGQPFLAERLSSVGYTCKMSGKWVSYLSLSLSLSCSLSPLLPLNLALSL